MTPPPLALALALLPLLLAGCQRPTPQSRANAAAKAECRAVVDRVYAAQNRAELSELDRRDTPFSEGYLSGVPTRGLGARFGRDNLEASCVNAAGENPATVRGGTGPTFSPAAPR